MFRQIVVVDKAGLHDWAIEKLQLLSEKPVLTFLENPKNNAEIIERIKNADCVFVSYKTKLNSEVLSAAKSLEYVGMCCSLYDKKSANVDIGFADKNGITVTGIRDYGDEGLAEFIVSELIRLMKGLGDLQWKEEPVELNNRKIGIIGLGTTGKMLANRLQAFGADMYYFSRTRKYDAEKEEIKFLPLDELLKTVEVISMHLPRNSNVLNSADFEIFGNGKILINTSLGLTFDKLAFENWIAKKGNFAIFDGDGIGGFNAEFEKYKNIISTTVVSGRTKEAYERLSQKVIDNVENFVKTKAVK